MTVCEWDPDRPGHTREVERELRPMVVRILGDGYTIDMIGSWEGHVARDVEAWLEKHGAEHGGKALKYTANNGDVLP
jgi:hypothetical protein